MNLTNDNCHHLITFLKESLYQQQIIFLRLVCDISIWTLALKHAFSSLLIFCFCSSILCISFKLLKNLICHISYFTKIRVSVRNLTERVLTKVLIAVWIALQSFIALGSLFHAAVASKTLLIWGLTYIDKTTGIITTSVIPGLGKDRQN